MSEQFCDDGHHIAQHDRSTDAYGYIAHAGCCDDVSAVQAQLCAVLYVKMLKEHAVSWVIPAVLLIYITHMCWPDNAGVLSKYIYIQPCCMEP